MDGVLPGTRSGAGERPGVVSPGMSRALGPAAAEGRSDGAGSAPPGVRGSGAAGAATSPGSSAPGAKGVAPIRLSPSTAMYVAAQAASP